MNRIKNNKRKTGFILTVFFLSFLLSFSACDSNKKETQADNMPGMIEIVTSGMDFQVTDTISSGWNTFHYINKSGETHFFLLEKYPEEKTIEDARKEIIPVFQSGMDLINDGKAEAGFAEFGKLPGWFGQIVFSGGCGLISPGKSSITTLKLDPGYYVMECYVKMPNGKFHSVMGMLKAVYVKKEDSGVMPPAADVNISISSTDGITYDSSLSKGSHIFNVTFKDQKLHEHFIGHDVNLVKLGANADTGVLEKWMNWSDPKGLITPAPEGISFLGGVNEMPAGKNGYFQATLEPGNYAFIAEVPNSSAKKMLKTFIISE